MHAEMYKWDGTKFVPWDGTVTAAPSGGTQPVSGTVGVSGTVPTSGTVTANVTKGSGANTQANVGTASTLVLAGNANRKEAIIVNAGNVTAYLGGSPPSSGTSLYFPPGATLIDNRGTAAWHGITASGTADIRVWEV